MISKLSLSHNLLTDFPYIKVCKEIKELRLNSNKISNIPSYIKKFNYLNIFDIGSNEFKEIPLIIKEIPVLLLFIIQRLKNFTFTGNPYCLDNLEYVFIKILYFREKKYQKNVKIQLFQME